MSKGDTITKFEAKRAKIGIDPCRKKGQVCRGAYIVHHADSALYLLHNGTWGHGANRDGAWFDTEGHATTFLNDFKNKK